MKDIPCTQLLSKLKPKTWKPLVTSTCPKKLYCQKRHLGCSEVKALGVILKIITKGVLSVKMKKILENFSHYSSSLLLCVEEISK